MGSVLCDARPRLSSAASDAKKKTRTPADSDVKMSPKHVGMVGRALKLDPESVVFIDETWAETT